METFSADFSVFLSTGEQVSRFHSKIHFSLRTYRGASVICLRCGREISQNIWREF